MCEDFITKLNLILFKEYDILDTFWWALEQDQFEAKWEALSWPNRLQKKLEETYEILEYETDRFQKIQVDDEFAMQDRIETITVNITNLSGQSDFSKVSWYNN